LSPHSFCQAFYDALILAVERNYYRQAPDRNLNPIELRLQIEKTAKIAGFVDL